MFVLLTRQLCNFERRRLLDVHCHTSFVVMIVMIVMIVICH